MCHFTQKLTTKNPNEGGWVDQTTDDK